MIVEHGNVYSSGKKQEQKQVHMSPNIYEASNEVTYADRIAPIVLPLESIFDSRESVPVAHVIDRRTYECIEILCNLIRHVNEGRPRINGLVFSPMSTVTTLRVVIEALTAKMSAEAVVVFTARPPIETVQYVFDTTGAHNTSPRAFVAS